MQDDDSSENSSDFEDFNESFQFDDEDDFGEVPDLKMPQKRYLIPNNVEDEVEGAIIFSDSFENRYGYYHLSFYQGTLESAFIEATYHPVNERNLLAIYLHHDESIGSNIFCQQILCSESVVEFMTSSDVIVWGWDVTLESNRQMLLDSVGKTFGPKNYVSTTISSLSNEIYPVIVVVSRIQSATEIVSVISGTVGADEMMAKLSNILQIYRATQRPQVQDKESREARQRLVHEQNEAYQESLRVDIAKGEARRAAEIQKKRDEEEQEVEAIRVELERIKVRDSLPVEPVAASERQEPICVLKCRYPTGKLVSRKFLQSSPLKVLVDFLFSEGYKKDKFKFLFSYPKKNLLEIHAETQQLGTVFRPQDTLIVESRY